VPLGRGEAGAPLFARSHVDLLGGILYHGSMDNGPLRVKPMKVVLESFLLEERLRPLKQSVMNSRLPKQMVSLREKPPHIKPSPSEDTTSTDG
jgi:hypothetical protein